MKLIDVSTGKSFQTEILPVEPADYRNISKSRYHFNWKDERDYEVYKQVIKGHDDILGLISFERIPEEWRIHIRLLTASKENIGEEKKYENVAANLLVFVSKLAVLEFGPYACVSLRPKSSIAQHYIDQYNMRKTGVTLSIEVPEIIALINKYE